MGIPGLTARLLSRGSWVTLEEQRPEENASTVSPTQPQLEAAFVDGPSLVYHIHHELSVERRRCKALSTALQPSYAQLGQRVICFLENMEAVGLTM